MSEDPKHSDAWLEVVRRKTQQSTCELPPDSWDAIAKAAGIGHRRGRMVRLWGIVAAVAAAVVLAVGVATLGVRVDTVNQAAAPLASSHGVQPSVATSADEAIAATNAPGHAYHMAAVTAADKKKTGVAARDADEPSATVGSSNGTESAVEKTTAEASEGLEAAPQDDRCSVPNEGQRETSTAENRQPEQVASARSAAMSNGYRGKVKTEPHGGNARHEGGNALRLYGNGIILAAANSENSGKVQMVTSNSDGIIFAAPRRTKFTYDHKIPITVGLSFSKRIPFNMELSTGLVYTLMTSDVTAELTGTKFTQRVQFLGIPLGVRWNFWNWRHFSTYLGGEVLGEKVIDAKYGDDKVDVDRLQWSLHGLVGVRYTFGDHVGFYLEPKLSHYMTELPLTTIRNEHPINMNVQFGLSVQF